MGKFVHNDEYDGSMKLSKSKQLVKMALFKKLNDIVNYQRYTASMVNGKSVAY